MRHKESFNTCVVLALSLLLCHKAKRVYQNWRSPRDQKSGSSVITIMIPYYQILMHFENPLEGHRNGRGQLRMVLGNNSAMYTQQIGLQENIKLAE